MYGVPIKKARVFKGEKVEEGGVTKEIEKAIIALKNELLYVQDKELIVRSKA